MAEFKPIVTHKKKSTLTPKNVNVVGNQQFDFDLPTSNRKTAEGPVTEMPAKEPEQIDTWKTKATMTAKLSPATNLKISNLKPFMREIEDGSIENVNDILNMLVDNYVNTRLTNRQQQAFATMFDLQFDLLKPRKSKK